LAKELILGEFKRTIDERFRVSLPTEFFGSDSEDLADTNANWILTKERPGSLSLWDGKAWQDKLDAGIDLVRSKINAGRLDGRIQQVQLLGRLLSTRHKTVQLAGRSRLTIPEGFREFLGVEPSGEVLLIGAAVCVEIWRPDAWIAHLEQTMPEFQQLFDNLSA
jgi:MraZ protein